jgi:predicted GH43/DUF377 family glycosyl hydrolase
MTHLPQHLSRRAFVALSAAALTVNGCKAQTHAGWQKSPSSPVLGGTLGTCFDVCVLKVGAIYRMYFSWRPKKSIAVVESTDGIHWTAPSMGEANTPQIVLGPDATSGWEDDINRPVVLQHGGQWHMWYTGQTAKQSYIGYAVSADGLAWRRMNPTAADGKSQPVLSPKAAWEGVAVMAPHVLWDGEAGLFKMWYSGGEQYEPNALGYATSKDGVAWTALPKPVMQGDPNIAWEKERVTAAHIERWEGYYYAFYIGFKNVNEAAIGIARSRDGIGSWERLPENPIVRPGSFGWDSDACYKPSVIHEKGRWLLWYNGRKQHTEQIGLATHDGDSLGF